MKKIALAVVMAVVLTLGLAGAASADVPPLTKTYAKQMQCRWPEPASVMGGGKNRGVSCVVKNSKGRQEFYILKYRNIERAVDFWKDWIDNDGYVARKGRIMIISQGNGGNGESYTYEWAKYAANHVDGRIIRGY